VLSRWRVDAARPDLDDRPWGGLRSNEDPRNRTWAGHGDVRQTWNRYDHLVPGGEQAAAERLDAFLTPPTVAQDPSNDETPDNSGVLKYRYRDSNPASEE